VRGHRAGAGLPDLGAAGEAAGVRVPGGRGADGAADGRPAGGAGAHAAHAGDARGHAGRVSGVVEAALLPGGRIPPDGVELPSGLLDGEQPAGVRGAARGGVADAVYGEGSRPPAGEHTGEQLLRGAVQRAQLVPRADTVCVRAAHRARHPDGQRGQPGEPRAHAGVDRAVRGGKATGWSVHGRVV